MKFCRLFFLYIKYTYNIKIPADHCTCREMKQLEVHYWKTCYINVML